MEAQGTSGAGKADAYLTFGNVGLLRAVEEHLPPGGSVLDVGCASGGLLAALDGRAGRREGIEPDPEAAARAAEVADRVHVVGLGDPVDLPSGGFDVVVLGDVLEHVADPRAALAAAAPWVAPGGVALVSLPNVAHWSIRLRLLRGRWDYEPTGIMDDTHLRFFTWRTGRALLAEAGFEVLDQRPVLPALHHFVGRPIPRPIEGAWRRLGRARPNAFAFQQLLVARPRTAVR